MNKLGLLAVGAGVVESLRPTLVPRTTMHQALVTAGCAAMAGAAAAPGSRLEVPRWVLPVAAGVGLWRARTHVRAQRSAYPEWTPRAQRPLVAVGVGAAVGAAVVHSPRLAVGGSRKAGAVLSSRVGGHTSLWALGVAGTVAALAGGLGYVGARLVLERLSEVGTRPDPALLDPPDNPYVSGGPASIVDYSTLARDGRRFVSLRTPAEEIRAFVPEAIEPIRAYSGWYSADTVRERVDLAMADLEGLGALERAHLLIMCPSGSGYADYVAAEAFEFFTGGDCASVVVQYGVLPSMLSVNRVPLGAEGCRMLLDRLLELPRRPRIWMYGESLGAQVAQQALQLEPSLVDEQARVQGIDALVSVGTPGGPSLRNRFRDSDNVVHLDRWQQLTGAEQAQLWFVDHDADPVTRWDGQLAVRFPYWLRRPRGRNIPGDMNWLPALTWWQVIFDLAFAAQQQSGEFRSVGHDYRADLAPILRQVFGSDLDPLQVAAVLAQREVVRDQVTSQRA